MSSKKHLEEIFPYIWISKSDPDYYRKYLKFHPNDKNALYQFGKQLIEEGRITEGIEHLEKAGSLGHYSSIYTLKELEKSSKSSFSNYQKQYANAKKTNPYLFPTLITLLSILLLLLLLWITFSFLYNSYLVAKNKYYYEQNEYYTVTNETIIDPNETGITGPLFSRTTASEMEQLLVLNAVARYKELNGSYPNTLEELYYNGNGNTITYLPNQKYYYQPEPFQLQIGHSIFHGEVPPTHLLELHFYSETNELALMRGNGETLAVYPVAASQESLPFSKSMIINRVVNPIGTAGYLGTRGLALHNDYAIHGTNDPMAIGKDITLGCIRLTDEDIEVIYPYVALGTPFIVMTGSPGLPTFPSGLPIIDVPEEFLKAEETPTLTYNWKG